ncbi:MAG: hypothetical protein AAF934_12075 [Bacteroidota bacterium]
MKNKSDIFERIKMFSARKGFKNLSDFSDYVGFKAPEKLYRLRRVPKSRPSFGMLAEMANTFDDLNLNWLVTGTGEMLLPEKITAASEGRGSTDMKHNPVADSITGLLKAIVKVNETGLKEDIEQLQHQLQDLAESEKEIKEKVDDIYKMLLKTELSEHIEKTIDKIRE